MTTAHVIDVKNLLGVQFWFSFQMACGNSFPRLNFEDKEEYYLCPFDDTHQILAKRFVYHIGRCRVNFPHVDVKTCSFNARHIVQADKFDQHMATCPDRMIIYQETRPCETFFSSFLLEKNCMLSLTYCLSLSAVVYYGNALCFQPKTDL